MSYAYLHAAGPSPPRTSQRSVYEDVLDSIILLGRRAVAKGQSALTLVSDIGPWAIAQWTIRRTFTVANAVILLWIYALWWGERSVFRESVRKCAYDGWERWVWNPPTFFSSFLNTNSFDAMVYSHNQQLRITLPSSQIHSWSTPILIPAVRGPCRHLRSNTRTSIYGDHSLSYRRSWFRIQSCSWAICSTGEGNGRRATVQVPRSSTGDTMTHTGRRNSVDSYASLPIHGVMRSVLLLLNPAVGGFFTVCRGIMTWDLERGFRNPFGNAFRVFLAQEIGWM